MRDGAVQLGRSRASRAQHRRLVRVRASLVVGLPFAVLFLVPVSGFIALTAALAATPYMRERGLKDAGGWAVLYVLGVALGALGTLWTLVLTYMVVSGYWTFL